MVSNKGTLDYLKCQAQSAFVANEWNQAIMNLENLVEMEPKWIFGYQKMGHALYREKRYEEAL